MPSTTVSTVILTAVILAIVLLVTPLARNFASAQLQPAAYLELRNLSFMVEEQMVSTAAAARQVDGSLRTQVDMPRALYGNAYTVTVTKGALVAVTGNVKFTTPLPSLQGVLWLSSNYKSGGTRVFVVANMTSGVVDVSLSD